MAFRATFVRNFPVFKQSLIAAIGNTGLFVKVVSVLLLIGYGLTFTENGVLYLSVTPGYLIPPTFWVWTAFTHCFVELRLWQVCVDLVTLALCGKLIEPLWGSFEMWFFFLLVNISVAFISTLFYLCVYMATEVPDILFEVHIQGMAGYIAGLSVAVKQVMPDHVLFHTRTPLGKITNRHVPLLIFLASMILYACGVLEGLYSTMIGCGIAVSWIYLRFYQVHTNGTRGDMAESFVFASFFPTVVQPPVAFLSAVVFGALVRLRVCRRAVRRYDVGAPTAIAISLPGMTSSDADRRRQKALRLLSERLSQQPSTTPDPEGESWPLLEAPDTGAVAVEMGDAGSEAPPDAAPPKPAAEPEALQP